MKTFGLLVIMAIAVSLLAVGCTAPAVKDQSQVIQQGVTNVNAQTQPNAAANGDTVYVDYTGSLQDGTVFDTSIQSVAQKANLPPRPSYSPLNFVVGAGQMIQGFDEAVVGMKAGDEKTVTIPPEKAYGAWSKDNVVDVPLSKIGNSAGIKLGSVLNGPNGLRGVVTGMANTTNDTLLSVDFNNELAGKTLVFDIKMVKVVKKT